VCRAASEHVLWVTVTVGWTVTWQGSGATGRHTPGDADLDLVLVEQIRVVTR
jgi:hypothetical protein